jgi:hypothetical protein
VSSGAEDLLGIAGSKPIVIYIEQVRSDEWGYSVFASNLVKRWVEQRPAEMVAIAVWPNRKGESDCAWIGGDGAKNIGRLAARLQRGARLPDPEAIAQGLKTCCDLAKPLGADIVVIDCVSGINDLPAPQKRAFVEASKGATIHVISYLANDPKELVRLVSGRVVAVYEGEAPAIKKQ